MVSDLLRSPVSFYAESFQTETKGDAKLVLGTICESSYLIAGAKDFVLGLIRSYDVNGVVKKDRDRVKYGQVFLWLGSFTKGFFRRTTKHVLFCFGSAHSDRFGRQNSHIVAIEGEVNFLLRLFDKFVRDPDFLELYVKDALKLNALIFKDMSSLCYLKDDVWACKSV